MVHSSTAAGGDTASAVRAGALAATAAGGVYAAVAISMLVVAVPHTHPLVVLLVVLLPGLPAAWLFVVARALFQSTKTAQVTNSRMFGLVLSTLALAVFGSVMNGDWVYALAFAAVGAVTWWAQRQVIAAANALDAATAS